ncbi:MAG: hypothetical protein A2W29_08285 [Gemmatimonadetes bacterium RBG_16_66_8]|nr:MAG: hypothetical protein A2W29_08285 [Gemmatimonadetes bacterium RBG_16_66_8]
MRPETLYDLIAPAYAKVMAPLLEAANARAVERVVGGAPANALEIGVGPGTALQELVRAQRQVVGIDVSAAMLRHASSRLAQASGPARLVRADALRLPFAKNTFDAVLSTFVLDLLPDDELRPMLGELSRVLVPGGRAVLGLLELPNPLIARAWMTVHRLVPDVLGRVRPVDLTAPLAGQPLRLARDERLDGLMTTRIVTLVKVSG